MSQREAFLKMPKELIGLRQPDSACTLFPLEPYCLTRNWQALCLGCGRAAPIVAVVQFLHITWHG